MQAPSRSLIFNLTAALEGALLLAAAVWIYFAHIPLLQHMQFSPHACLIGFFVSLGTTAFSVFALTLGKGLPVLRELKKMSDEVLAPMVEILGYFDILFISLVSGFCEEVLFRGVVQAQIGLLPASLFFGLFHDPTLRHKSYLFHADGWNRAGLLVPTDRQPLVIYQRAHFPQFLRTYYSSFCREIEKAIAFIRFA